MERVMFRGEEVGFTGTHYIKEEMSAKEFILRNQATIDVIPNSGKKDPSKKGNLFFVCGTGANEIIGGIGNSAKKALADNTMDWSKAKVQHILAKEGCDEIDPNTGKKRDFGYCLVLKENIKCSFGADLLG